MFAYVKKGYGDRNNFELEKLKYWLLILLGSYY